MNDKLMDAAIVVAQAASANGWKDSPEALIKLYKALAGLSK